MYLLVVRRKQSWLSYGTLLDLGRRPASCRPIRTEMQIAMKTNAVTCGHSNFRNQPRCRPPSARWAIGAFAILLRLFGLLPIVRPALRAPECCGHSVDPANVPPTASYVVGSGGGGFLLMASR